jgi:hypothetical protein
MAKVAKKPVALDPWNGWARREVLVRSKDPCAKVYLHRPGKKCPPQHVPLDQIETSMKGKTVRSTPLCVRCAKAGGCPKGKKCVVVRQDYRLANGNIISDFKCVCK